MSHLTSNEEIRKDLCPKTIISIFVAHKIGLGPHIPFKESRSFWLETLARIALK